MNSILDLNQFNDLQLKLLYCAVDSNCYRTLLLIERDLPGKAGSAPNFDLEELDRLEQERWVKILSKQIDIELSLAYQVQYQHMLEAIEDPIRAELIASTQPTPPKVVIARIEYQLTDRGILALVPAKADIRPRFEQNTQQMGHMEGLGQRIYVISVEAIGHFSIRVKTNED